METLPLIITIIAVALLIWGIIELVRNRDNKQRGMYIIAGSVLAGALAWIIESTMDRT